MGRRNEGRGTGELARVTVSESARKRGEIGVVERFVQREKRGET